MSVGRAVVLALVLGGCGYEAPGQTNVDSEAYRTDLATCETTARSTVNTQNAKRALVWFASGVRRWGQIGDATQSCMAGKGYGSVRWCTAEELRSGNRTGGLVVTASGVQCMDPPSPERRKPAT